VSAGSSITRFSIAPIFSTGGCHTRAARPRQLSGPCETLEAQEPSPVDGPLDSAGAGT